MNATESGRIFQTQELIPAEWKGPFGEGIVRAFNPGLLQNGAEWIMAYRVVGPDGRRRIGVCRLDHRLRVIGGSQLPLSDHVRFNLPADAPENARSWLADPRLYRFGGRVFLYWNSGWHEPRNYQFLQELDPGTLRPIGVARELVLRGSRQKLEKNWSLFAGDNGRVLAIYSVQPHVVLELSLASDDKIVCEEVARSEWSMDAYPASHGGLRGGAPPCLVNGAFWSICHSVHSSADGYRYAAAVYSFSAIAPFRPVAAPTRHLELRNPFGGQRTHARLNPAVGEVIYPCGAAHDGARWWISYGINDEHCALCSLEHGTLVRSTEVADGAN